MSAKIIRFPPLVDLREQSQVDHWWRVLGKVLGPRVRRERQQTYMPRPRANVAAIRIEKARKGA